MKSLNRETNYEITPNTKEKKNKEIIIIVCSH